MTTTRSQRAKHFYCCLTLLPFLMGVVCRAMPAAEPDAQQAVRIPIAPDTGEVTASLCTGTGQPGIVITLEWSDGSKTNLRAQAALAAALPDASIDFPELQIKNYARPNPEYYSEKFRKGLVQKWGTLPPASEHLFPLSLRLDAKGVGYWIDGRYAGRLDKNAQLKEVTFTASAGATVKDARDMKRTDGGRFLSLDIARIARPGVMKDAELSLKPGTGVVNGVPFTTGAGNDNADVGVAKEMSSAGIETDPYMTRTAFDGMPESLIISVPLTQYVRAWVLCAAEDDPAREPVLTVRLTRGASDGHGDAIADTTVWLPREGEEAAPGMTRVGTVTYAAKEGGKRVSLWLAEIPLKVGEIQDLVFIHKNEACNDGMLPDRRYLDFEMLGKLDGGRIAQYPWGRGRMHRPDGNSVSGVHVFGVTLEKTPVEMEVRQTLPGNIFHGDEKPEVAVALRALQKGTYSLKWTIRDVDDKPVADGQKRVTLDADAGEQVVMLPLAMKDKGWYGLDVSLDDVAGRRLLTHPAAFALLPEDTRRAGYESPYGGWWFGEAHRGTPDPAIIGPLMLKAGLRKSEFLWHKVTEADLAPWKMTSFMVPWMGGMYSGLEGNLPAEAQKYEAAAQKYEAAVRDHLRQFPHCSAAMIFHESREDIVPPELRDSTLGPVPEIEAQRTRKRLAAATYTAKMLREKFPQLKIIFGNSGSGVALAAEAFRNKFPKEYIDYLGTECTGQTMMPEKPCADNAAGACLLREVGRKMGYDLPVSNCFEALAYTQRELGAQRMAEWAVRDVLIAQAFRYPHIQVGLIYDAGNCYYNTLWGAGGVCQRYPLLYPKPAYVACATVTRVLDDVKLVRRVPTGSMTLYALEFTRDDKRIYALWTPRGNCAATLHFGKDVTLTVEDLYGRSRQVDAKGGDLALDAGTAPQYVMSSVAVEVISAGIRTFPQDKPPANLTVVNAMDKAAEWQIGKEKDPRLEAPDRDYLPLRTLGQYAVREADDPEKGRCLELELMPVGKVPTIMNEYTLLKLKTPAPVPGRPTTLGAWVKGNSGWGRIMWEFQDAAGKTWLSCGEGGWGCDILDWPGDISISFDGWCFLRVPISEDSPVKLITYGGTAAQWTCTGEKSVPAYPIKLTGLAVEMTRKSLDLSELAPVSPVIRFKDLSAF
jgi:hypothetical protein